MCAHREQPRGLAWRCVDPACQEHPEACACLAVSERIQDTRIILPLYPQMALADVRAVVNALVAALDEV